MPKLDLNPTYLSLVRRILAEQAPDAEVWAYGSRITSTAHDGSDLDLVARNPGDLSQRQPDLFAIKEAFVESDLPILVDIFDWATLPDSFRREIEQAYVVIQKAESTIATP